MDLNPYAPPSAPQAASVLVAVDEATFGPMVERHTIPNRAAIGQWELCFHEHGLVALRGDGLRLSFSPTQLVADTDLVLGTVVRMLAVRQPTRTSIPLPPEAVRALRRLLDPVLAEHLAAALKRRVRLSLPIGLFVVAISLPFVVALDVGGLVFGGGMVLLSLGSRVVKHRALWILDAFVWAVLATNNAVRLARGGSWFDGLFVVLGLMFAVGALKVFAFYGPTPTANLRR